MDLNDTPEQAEYRAQARAWLEANRDQAPPRAGSSEDSAYIDSRRAWQRRLAEAGLAAVTWPTEFGGRGLGPIEQVTVNQEISRARGPRHPRRDRHRDARSVPDRPRHRGSEEPSPRPDAPRRRGLVPDVLRAQCGLGPGRGADPRVLRRRRQLDAQRPEGLDDQRAVRVIRPADRPHRCGRPQAQGVDDVRRADGRTRGHSARSAADFGRGRVQRGVLRRRPAGLRRRRRRGWKRLGYGAHGAHVRALDDRLWIGVVRLPDAVGTDAGCRPTRHMRMRTRGAGSAR